MILSKDATTSITDRAEGGRAKNNPSPRTVSRLLLESTLEKLVALTLIGNIFQGKELQSRDRRLYKYFRLMCGVAPTDITSGRNQLYGSDDASKMV